MKLDDMILVSVDDHVIEPRDMFERHMPKSRLAEAPKVVNDNGVDRWVFQGTPLGPTGLNAVVSWPKTEWNNDPVGYPEMRPGCYEVKQRIDDMNANGILGSMCFPTFPGFAGTHLMHAPDKTLSKMIVSAYNDWHIDEWCASDPARFLPLAILPLWDVDACVAEIHRCAAKGFTAVTLPETPYATGMPSYYTDHWDPVMQAIADTDVVMCLHIGGAFQLLRRPEEAPLDERIIMSPQLSAVAATDFIVGGVLNRFPTLRVAMSEGGMGWIAPLLDRMDLHVTNQSWLDLDLGGLMPTDIWKRNFLACFISNRSSLRLRDRIGVETIAWECDYPHSDCTWPKSAELLWDELVGAELSDEEIDMVTYANACRFFKWDPFARTAKADATVGALRAKATGIDISTTSRTEYRRRFDELAGV